MSKCLKCGAALPPVGECPACAAAAGKPATPSAVPSLLDKDIQIDRRLTPERTPAVSGSAVPTFAELARGPATPPGMTPVRPAAAPQGALTPPAMRPAERLPTPAPMPAAQAAAVPPSMPPPQRLPVPAPAPALQTGSPPPAEPRGPTGVALPSSSAQVFLGDPDETLPDTLPGVPRPRAASVMPRAEPELPAAAASSRAPVGDPDTTAPGQPPFTPPPPSAAPSTMASPTQRVGLPVPPSAAPSMMASPAQQAELPASPSSAPSMMASPTQQMGLPVPTSAPQARPLDPEPTTASRQMPAPVEVVTFAPPSRMPPPPPSSVSLPQEDLLLTPRIPIPALAPRATEPAATTAPGQGRPRTSSAPGAQEIHARPASLWRRLLSFTIDTTALVGVATLYILLASSIAGVKSPSSQGLTPLDSLAAWMHALKSVLLPGLFLLLVLATVYCAVAAFLWNGRTLGRLLLGLRLVDTHGLAPAPSRAIVRALLSVVSFGLFLGGFWMALFDRRGQTLHDKLTSTFVVQPG
ncbi:RDD family protein [Hyalangium sp.]|uniref:RDD family protein n=1 Tax=Hyalangium sp. TaxID=2028555 RepID=UPI002D6656E4|nr:RDD family protein [Hyalangium sp.]HYH99324.1 RDD family protein [Hyalangium sp.]